MHTAQGAYSKHAPGAVCIQIMLLEHIWLKSITLRLFMVQDHIIFDLDYYFFFQIINCQGPYGLGAYGPGPISRSQNLKKIYMDSLYSLEAKIWKKCRDMDSLYSLITMQNKNLPPALVYTSETMLAASQLISFDHVQQIC